VTALRVAVVAGGASSEAAVSRASAAGVSRALLEAGHRGDVLELDRKLPAFLLSDAYDVVFPAVHGRLGEDGSLQGLLEVLDVPYVGSGVLASALAMSKPHAKAQFGRVELPVAKDAMVFAGEDMARRAWELRRELGAALVVKPASGGSAIGVEIVGAEMTDDVLGQVLARVLAFDPVALIEQFKSGKEVTCAVLEDDNGPRALPPTLITPVVGGFYDFRSKYAPAGSRHECPAPFDAALTARIQEYAKQAHAILGCRDLSRVDFVVDDASGDVTVLEVNTLPGMTATSLFPEAAASAGIPFPALCDFLVRRAMARPRLGPPDAPAMPT
jgi:D-alanine-D-alanine ligase